MCAQPGQKGLVKLLLVFATLIWFVAPVRAEKYEDQFVNSIKTSRQGDLESGLAGYKTAFKGMQGELDWKTRLTLEYKYSHEMAEICLEAYDLNCAIEPMTNLTNWLTKTRSSQFADQDYIWKSIAVNEKYLLALTIMGEYSKSREVADLIVKLLKGKSSAENTQVFISSNLTLATWYSLVKDKDLSKEYLDRAWVNFLSYPVVNDDLLIKYGILFAEMFNQNGDVKRSIDILNILYPSFLRNISFNKYQDVRFLFNYATAKKNEANLISMIKANELALGLIRELQIPYDTKQSFITNMQNEVVAACLLNPAIEQCRNAELYKKNLLTFVEQGKFDGVHKFSITLVTSFSDVVQQRQLTAQQISDLKTDFNELDWHQEATISYSAAKKVRNFLIEIMSGDISSARLSVLDAVEIELKRIEVDRNKDLFKYKPLNLHQITLLRYLVDGVVEFKGKVDDPRIGRLVFEANEVLTNGLRSIEAQYLTLLAKTNNNLQRSSLKTLNRMQMELSLLERKLLSKNVQQKINRDFSKEYGFNLGRLTRLDHKVKSFKNSIGTTFTESDETVSKLDRLQSLLKEDEIFINYQVYFGKLVTACVTKRKVHIGVNSLDVINSTDFKLIASALTNPSDVSEALDRDFPVKAAARISKLLLGGVESCFVGANYVYMNQDDSLSGFSPHILIDPRKGLDNYLNSELSHLNVPWLGLSYSIGMLSGSSHLIAARKLNYKNVNSGGMLGIGAPVLTGVTNDGQPRSQVAMRGVSNVARGIQELDELPDTKDELESAKTYYPQARSNILVGKDATELTLRKRTLRQEDLLIFATHGLIREEISGLLEPALVLTPNSSTSDYDDGLFTASDISRLDLSTNLVILSACNSAKFELDLFATEAASLSTAFFLAGSKSTLASLWSVNSEATSILMKNFNKIYSSGKSSAAESLKISMLSLARADTPKYAHPKYWASFVAYGDPSVLFNLNPESQGFRLSIADKSQLAIGHIQEAVIYEGMTYVSGAKPKIGLDTYVGYLSKLDASSRPVLEHEFDDSFVKLIDTDKTISVLKQKSDLASKQVFSISRLNPRSLHLDEVYKFNGLKSEMGWKPIFSKKSGHIYMPTTILDKSSLENSKYYLRLIDFRGKKDKKVVVESSFIRYVEQLYYSILDDGLIKVFLHGNQNLKPSIHVNDRYGSLKLCDSGLSTEVLTYDSSLNLINREIVAGFKYFSSTGNSRNEFRTYIKFDSCANVQEAGVSEFTNNNPISSKPFELYGYEPVSLSMIDLPQGKFVYGNIAKDFDDADVSEIRDSQPVVSIDAVVSTKSVGLLGILLDKKKDVFTYDVLFSGVDVIADAVTVDRNGKIRLFGASADKRLVTNVDYMH